MSRGRGRGGGGSEKCHVLFESTFRENFVWNSIILLYFFVHRKMLMTTAAWCISTRPPCSTTSGCATKGTRSTPTSQTSWSDLATKNCKVCHGFRIIKQDDFFFKSILTTSKSNIIFKGSWGSNVNWLVIKIKLP